MGMDRRTVLCDTQVVSGQDVAENSDPGSNGDSPPGSTPAYFNQVYRELRALADRQLRNERPGMTLQPTALVHEVFLRMSRGGTAVWDNPKLFFAAAAESMRRILIERARRYSRIRHGGGRLRIALDEAQLAGEVLDCDALLTLEQALSELQALDPPLAEVVMLRYFAGLSVQQTAEVLGRSERSVKYDWAAARAWLLRRMNAEKR